MDDAIMKGPSPTGGCCKRVRPILPSGEGRDEGILNQAIILFYPLTLTLLCPSGCSRRERGLLRHPPERERLASINELPGFMSSMTRLKRDPKNQEHIES